MIPPNGYSNKGINKGDDGNQLQMYLSLPGMLLSPPGDLSHTSIFYYCRIIDTKIFEYYWRQVVSKNKM